MPPPLSSDLFVEVQEAPATYFVASYSGRSNEKKMMSHAEQLADFLDGLGLQSSYDYSNFYFAGYDSPFRLFNRHNEIWLPAKST